MERVIYMQNKKQRFMTFHDNEIIFHSRIEYILAFEVYATEEQLVRSIRHGGFVCKCCQLVSVNWRAYGDFCVYS